MAYRYAAHVAKALSSHDPKRKWVGVVLRGDAGSPFPPNVIVKRLSGRAFATTAEARAHAQKHIDRHFQDPAGTIPLPADAAGASFTPSHAPAARNTPRACIEIADAYFVLRGQRINERDD